MLNWSYDIPSLCGSVVEHCLVMLGFWVQIPFIAPFFIKVSSDWRRVHTAVTQSTHSSVTESTQL